VIRQLMRDTCLPPDVRHLDRADRGMSGHSRPNYLDEAGRTYLSSLGATLAPAVTLNLARCRGISDPKHLSSPTQNPWRSV
jgi:hypothetical protein